MALVIYNSLTRKKETFTPINAGQVGMYVCGMTVYDFCHLGHARVMIGFDVIARYLRYSGYKVNYIRNITDIDDKIISRANENNESMDALTERFIAAMNEDAEKLNVEKPDQEPRATQHIGDIINLINTLVEKGYAYQADNGDVYYAVRKFEQYGKLSGKVLDELESGARVEVDSSKRDPLDFVLWKSAKQHEPHWDSPWGIGRPGWHIECSAMSTCCLGDTFDIHGGGPDLKFPHHENEIAQSEAATGQQYAHTWMHAGAVRVDGEKMSKSLGNFFTIREILEQYSAEVVRFFLLSSHYRSPINYSQQSLEESQQKLERFYTALHDAGSPSSETLSNIENEYSTRFMAAMDDDFNTPEAISVLFDLAKEVNKSSGELQNSLAGQLRYLGNIIGCLQCDPESFLQGDGGELDVNLIESLIKQRADAKVNKDFQRADAIRDQLTEMGVVLKDSAEGTSWQKA